VPAVPLEHELKACGKKQLKAQTERSASLIKITRSPLLDAG
jgi:hypothetical protein